MITQPDNTTSTDRVAIVTGGSRGIGREVARELASRRYAVVINYLRNQGDADAAVEDILAANGTAIAVRADVADELDVERLFTETTEAFSRVDVVVHAAGRMIVAPVADYDLDSFDALQRTNVRGTFLVNRQALRQLRGGGAIVNFSNPAADMPVPTYAAYAASKGAIEALTRVLARDLRGRDVTVNAVAPGMERPGTQADIANLVAFLVSEDGHWVNGQVIRTLFPDQGTDQGQHGRDKPPQARR
jgi:3-oxoacyl-[acyl-carrier protein] reductase